jgi:carboxymethylenebutenolidase
MCYDDRARPPMPPIAGGADAPQGERITLRAGDGNTFAAYSARAATAGAPGMVVMPDVRGLHPFFEELAERFAGAGVHATAIDYFGRTAGIGDRGPEFEYMPHVQQTKPEAIAMDVAAAVQHLRSPVGGGAERIFTVGFCFGGRASFNQAAEGHGLSGVVGFYGFPTPRDEEDTNAPSKRLPSFECPVLGLFGGADKGIPRGAVEEFERLLNETGIHNEIAIYEGAPHSFFDRTYEEHADACADAWRRILRFVQATPA